MPNKSEPSTVELDKLRAVKAESQAIGEFLDEFLCSKGVRLAKPHYHSDSCYTQGYTKEEFQKRYGKRTGQHPKGNVFWEDKDIPAEDWELGRHSDPRCGIREGALLPWHYNTEKLLAEFFGIDLRKAEEERRTILAELHNRAAHVVDPRLKP